MTDATLTDPSHEAAAARPPEGGRSHSHPLGGPLDHPVRGRINAWFFQWMAWYLHWKQGGWKARLFADLPKDIVEIGAGVGANFRYLQPGSRVVAYEPNVHMHDQLERVAADHGIVLEAHVAGAEAMDLPDESVDAVICTLVLCTVADVQRTLQQVRRVLRPGGRFICIEHVAAAPHTFIGRIQRWVHRPWAWFFEGCHTHRDTQALLEQAGFRELSLQRWVMPTLFLPVRPHIAAVAVK
jgi:ubiquinone/menaquinone biosynthesis C-methylase UbiE